MVMRETHGYTAERRSASGDTVRLPWLDMWQRGGGIYGALAGLKLELMPIEDAPLDGPHWRLYVTQRMDGVERDRSAPTRATRPAPTGWAEVRERQSLTKQLAAIGMQAPYYRDELEEGDPSSTR
jgi:hypothetical protein